MPAPLIAEELAVVDRDINSLNMLTTSDSWRLGSDLTVVDIYLF